MRLFDNPAPSAYAQSMDWSTFFKNYQILFASLVALAGVIITLIVNARTSRRALISNAKLARHQLQAERKLDRDRRDDERRHERQAIRAALISELTVNQSALELCVKAEKINASFGNQKNYKIRRVNRLDDVYLGFLPRIGILSKYEVEVILKIYHAIQEIDEFLTTIALPDSKTAVSVIIPSENTEKHFRNLKGLIELIAYAINYLEKMEKEEG